MAIRGIFSSMDISASGLLAQRRRLDAVAQNLANSETTRTEEGGPFQRRIVIFGEDKTPFETVSPGVPTKLDIDYSDLDHLSINSALNSYHNLSGVKTNEVRDNTEPELVYDPGHPDADARGYVAYPKINPIQEMTDLIAAARAYEANAAVIQSAKGMFRKALEI
ncbi:MAG: flagellar basal body rod protein FlgC [bacterium]|nr:flagellar basal body rod protein FlgC [bacterium]